MSQEKANPNGGGTFGFQQESDLIDILAQDFCNENYQRNVIGNMLNDNKKIDELNLDAVVFDGRHSTIYYAMLSLKRQGKPVDVLTVSEELENNGELEKIGGFPYLDTLSSQAIQANVHYHAEKLKEASQLQSLALKAHALTKAIKNKASEETISKLVRNISESTIACHDNSLKPISANELKDCEPVQTLWGEIFYPEGIIQVNSEPGVGKTTLLYNLCLHGVLGKDFLGISFSHALKILYIDVETPLWKRANKLKAISEELPENLFFLDALDLKRDFPNLLTLCETEKYDLIVFDTQSKIFGQEQENDNAEANRIMELLRQLTKKTRCAIVLIHHTGKSESSKGVYRGRGASAIAGAVDVVVNMEALDNEVVKLVVTKNRIVGDYPVLFLKKVGEDKFEPYTSPEGSSGFEIYKVQSSILSLDPEKSWQTNEIYQLGEVQGFNETIMKRAISKLIQSGKLIRIKRGLYKLTSGHSGHSVYPIPDPNDPLTHADLEDFPEELR